MTRKNKERLQRAGIILGVVVAVGIIIGAIGGLTGNVKLKKERNPDNLITLESIKTAGVELGKEVKSSASDVKIEVTEKGVIKMSNKATANDTFKYAEVTLKPGYYRFAGAPDSAKDTYELYLTDGTNSYESEGGVIVVAEETTFDVEIRFYKGCEFGMFAEKLYPVLWEVDDSDDKTVVEFWK